MHLKLHIPELRTLAKQLLIYESRCPHPASMRDFNEVEGRLFGAMARPSKPEAEAVKE